MQRGGEPPGKGGVFVQRGEEPPRGWVFARKRKEPPGGGSFAYFMGRRTVKVVPSPGTLCTSTVPWW